MVILMFALCDGNVILQLTVISRLWYYIHHLRLAWPNAFDPRPLHNSFFPLMYLQRILFDMCTFIIGMCTLIIGLIICVMLGERQTQDYPIWQNSLLVNSTKRASLLGSRENVLKPEAIWQYVFMHCLQNCIRTVIYILLARGPKVLRKDS